METHPQNDQSLASLFRELRTEAAALLRQEAALAKKEMSLFPRWPPSSPSMAW